MTARKLDWNDDQLGILRKAWDEDKTAAQIASLIGNGAMRNAVLGKAHRLNLADRPSPIGRKITLALNRAPRNDVWNDDRVATLRRLWAENFSPTEIAEEIGNGMTGHRVSQKACRIKLPRREGLVGHRPSHGSAKSNVTSFRALVHAPYEGLALPLQDIGPGMCLYPVSSSDVIGHLFCGDAKEIGSYCLAHHEVCHRPSEPLKMKDAA